jgi:DNA-binding NtrC family response regulator
MEDVRGPSATGQAAMPHTVVGAGSDVTDDLELAARSAVPVLITGESGPSRQGCARFVHDNSRVGRGPFIGLSCLDRGSEGGDMRSVLERARGGTAFVDDVGAMSAGAQAQLLAFLDDESIRGASSADHATGHGVRMIAGTGDPLGPRIAAGTFSETLFYRLNIIHIKAPPGPKPGTPCVVDS